MQQAKTLDKVSTPSLEALQKYVAGNRALVTDGDFAKGSALLEEAIALDTGFAMAYRKLAIELRNRGLQGARAESLMQKAYDFRDRLSETERYVTLGSYYSSGPNRDVTKVIAAYESLLEIDSTNVAALNNLSIEYRGRREFAKAEALNRRAVALDSTTSVVYLNLILNQFSQGKLDAAAATVAAAARNLPRNPATANYRFRLEFYRGRYDSARAIYDSLAAARPNDAATRRDVAFALANLTRLRGQITEAKRHQAEARRYAVQLGNPGAAFAALIDPLEWDVRYDNNEEAALRELERVLALPEHRNRRRPSDRLIGIYAEAGLPDRAREEFRRLQQLPEDQRPDSIGMLGPQATLAWAEKRVDDGIRFLRALDRGGCQTCRYPAIADFYDLGGNADSAIVYFTRFVDGPDRNLGDDADWLPVALKRLGELHDAKGNVQQAMSYYARFVELWKNADAFLQPQVKQARDRLAELQRRSG